MQPALWDKYIEQAGENANADWMDAATAAVRRVCSRVRFFTTDDVWSELGSDYKTHEHRAMGAVMRRAKSEGWCVPTLNYEVSTREIAHGRPVRVWEAQ